MYKQTEAKNGTICK